MPQKNCVSVHVHVKPVLLFLSSQCVTLGWLCCITLYEPQLRIRKQ
ncbi:MAG: hypothetical protein ACR5LA_10550 [Wolbachia sp.]